MICRGDGLRRMDEPLDRRLKENRQLREDLHMIDMKNIGYLFAIEELGSVSAAARRLFISQPTLSQFLKKYEEELGCPIFIRTSQGLLLTPEGALFLETARSILRLEQDMKNRLSDMSETMTGSVTFAVSAQRAPMLLPTFLPDFCKSYPGIDVKIVEGRTKNLEHELKKGALDLGILIPSPATEIPSMEMVLEEEIVLAVPADLAIHGKIHREPGRLPWIDLCQLADAAFLLCDINNRLYDFANELFRQCHFTPGRTMTFKNLTLIAQLASAGMGVTFLPEGFIRPEYHLKYYSIGPEGCRRTLALGYPTDRYRPGAVEIFSGFVKEALLRQQRDFHETYQKG